MKPKQALISLLVFLVVAGCSAEFTVPFSTHAVDPELSKRAFNEAPECAKFKKTQTTMLDERDPQTGKCLAAIGKLTHEYEQETHVAH